MNCLHCRRARRIHRRGLCWPCYYSPARDLYPSGNPAAARNHSGTGKPPTGRALHGLEPSERVAVLLERAAAGACLFREDER